MSAELEQGLLADLLTWPEEVWPRVSDLVTEDLFVAHRMVAAVLLSRLRAGQPIDPTLLAAALPDEVRPFVWELARGHGTPAMARTYAEQLRKEGALRRARALVSEENAIGSMEDIDRLVQGLSEIQGGVAAGTHPARQLAGLLLDRIDELEKQRSDASGGVDSTVIPTGIHALDLLLGGLKPGKLVVVSSRPSKGKSSLALWLARSFAQRGIPTGVWWGEDDWRDLADRYFVGVGKIPSTFFRSGAALRSEHWERLAEVAGRTSPPIWVDDYHGLTPQELSGRMRVMYSEHKVRVFLFDHLGEMLIRREEGERHDQAIGRGVRLLRDTAKQLGACIVLFHQMSRDIERRQYKEPVLADLRDSGDIEAAARIVIFLTQPNETTLSLDVAKNSMGPVGKVEVPWLADFATLGSVGWQG